MLLVCCFVRRVEVKKKKKRRKEEEQRTNGTARAPAAFRPPHFGLEQGEARPHRRYLLRHLGRGEVGAAEPYPQRPTHPVVIVPPRRPRCELLLAAHGEFIEVVAPLRQRLRSPTRGAWCLPGVRRRLCVARPLALRQPPRGGRARRRPAGFWCLKGPRRRDVVVPTWPRRALSRACSGEGEVRGGLRVSFWVSFWVRVTSAAAAVGP